MLPLALRDTLKTLTTPYFLRMLLLSMLLTLIAFVLFSCGVCALVHFLHFDSGRYGGAILTVAWGFSLITAWTLFPVIVPLIGIVFLENVATHIDRREYAAERIASLPVSGELWHALRFAGMTILLNLLCLPVYLIATVFAPFVYYALNGYLIGREFFELAAARHMGRKAARVLRKRYNGSVFLGGAMIVFLANLPIANLFSPFIGAALMVHLFRRIEPAGVVTLALPPRSIASGN